MRGALKFKAKTLPGIQPGDCEFQSQSMCTFKCYILLVSDPFSLELYTNSVFSVSIRLIFLGFYRTITGGKLGRYISVLFFWREPLFSSKGGSCPPFWGAKPPFWGKKGFPPNLKEFPPNSLVLKIPTKIPTGQYHYMVYQYRYRASCQYQNGIQLYFSLPS